MGNALLTPIHRSLGIGASEFDLALVDQAVAASVIEDADLDWKAKLPDFSSDDARLELCKDVAAMANTRGGLVVYGVRENASRAEARVNVDVLESTQERLRQSLYLFLRPFVTDIRVLVAEDPTAPGFGVLALLVGRSPDAPHQVGRDGLDRIRFPYRDGATTKFMREHEIARAYSHRFDGRADAQTRINAIFDKAASNHAKDGSDWLIGIAVPLLSHRSSAPRLQKAVVEAVLSSGQGLSTDLLPEADDRHEALGEVSVASASEYHRRLRRSVVGGNGSRYGLAVHFELADDGGVIFDSGFRRLESEANPTLTVERIESFMVDLVSLASATANLLGVYGTWVVGVEIDHGSTPFSIGRLDRYAGGQDEFERIDTEIVFPAAPVELLDHARQLSLDVLEQFASSHLVKLPAGPS